MTRLLFCDTETYSEVPIKHGLYKYAAHAEVMLFAYAFDDGPVKVWDRTQHGMPGELYDALTNPEVLTVWHNSQFDRVVLRDSIGMSIDLPLNRVHDTMTRALAHGLPGALGTLCEVFALPVDQAKDKAGRQLINLFCKPRPKNMALRRATHETHPKEWAQFVDYARLDIVAMREIYKRLPKDNYTGIELELWQLDQKINDRGVCVDVELARAAIAAVDQAQASLSARTAELTGGAVARTTQRDTLLAHILAEHGVELPDMQSSTLERRINDTSLPRAVRELLAIRLQASTTSTAKYTALLNAVSPDERLRGTLQFCGASRTGRWSGRTFQPQNLPRPSHKQKEIDEGIEALKLGCVDLITDEVMKLTSSAIRGCIVAPPGKKLVVSDLSNIEGRVAAWIAGEQWKLNAFLAFDAGTGHDLYALAYAKSFGVTPESVIEDKKAGGNQRQIGKVQELALGYEGGVGAFLTFALVYGIDLEQLAANAWANIPTAVVGESRRAYQWAVEKKRSTFGLSERAYVVCDALKRMWREAHPAISSYWGALQRAAISATKDAGTVYNCGEGESRLRVRRDGAWLRVILPSGRVLCYASPRVEDGKLSYLGLCPYSRKWKRLNTYGGKLFENVCQAVARDVMAANMPVIEEAGFEIVLSVHDELITEGSTVDHTADALSNLLSAQPEWAQQLPLAAGGFEATRYKKD